MYLISKKFNFSASHVLNGLKENHPCSRLHGHNYAVTFCFRANYLNETGFVVDYRDLDIIKKFIDEKLDHQHLNDILDFNPTAENIAKFLYETFKPKFAELYRVEVSETPSTNAVYEKDERC
ncbi:MAG: 6-carboxytetrahydropterin synthase QueD [Prevotellaceae bacterium]|jgi:6-pyruvoyltetrahydropterin/6-carboxytetrahydropterin synthase|nr:6-carboxytetrahydropterin synthase QueD [Prevotellaceae bacterium]